MEQEDKRMTYGEIYKQFTDEICGAPVDDYRPICKEMMPQTDGIIVWLKNGDVCVYYPKEVEE